MAKEYLSRQPFPPGAIVESEFLYAWDFEGSWNSETGGIGSDPFAVKSPRKTYRGAYSAYVDTGPTTPAIGDSMTVGKRVFVQISPIMALSCMVFPELNRGNTNFFFLLSVYPPPNYTTKTIWARINNLTKKVEIYKVGGVWKEVGTLLDNLANNWNFIEIAADFTKNKWKYIQVGSQRILIPNEDIYATAATFQVPFFNVGVTALTAAQTAAYFDSILVRGLSG